MNYRRAHISSSLSSSAPYARLIAPNAQAKRPTCASSGTKLIHGHTRGGGGACPVHLTGSKNIGSQYPAPKGRNHGVVFSNTGCSEKLNAIEGCTCPVFMSKNSTTIDTSSRAGICAAFYILELRICPFGKTTPEPCVEGNRNRDPTRVDPGRCVGSGAQRSGRRTRLLRQDGCIVIRI